MECRESLIHFVQFIEEFIYLLFKVLHCLDVVYRFDQTSEECDA